MHACLQDKMAFIETNGKRVKGGRIFFSRVASFFVGPFPLEFFQPWLKNEKKRQKSLKFSALLT